LWENQRCNIKVMNDLVLDTIKKIQMICCKKNWGFFSATQQIILTLNIMDEISFYCRVLQVNSSYFFNILILLSLSKHFLILTDIRWILTIDYSWDENWRWNLVPWSTIRLFEIDELSTFWIHIENLIGSLEIDI